MKKNLKKIDAGKVKIFKIANRRGYAALCHNNLTEGATAFQAYQRMGKAVRRAGLELPVLGTDEVKRCVVAAIA
ncbi:MAG: hypothetical protein PHO30_09240 [Candidatus Omnitrophica bacterium]|nr:hypothetical protein [Candidatus Omnitrophota bacterium]